MLGSFWDHFRIILGTFWDHFGMILELFRDHFFGIFHWGNQVGIIGGTRLGARGTAAPQIHNTILYQVSKNPKGKPGWGTKHVPQTVKKSVEILKKLELSSATPTSPNNRKSSVWRFWGSKKNKSDAVGTRKTISLAHLGVEKA